MDETKEITYSTEQIILFLGVKNSEIPVVLKKFCDTVQTESQWRKLFKRNRITFSR